MKIPRSNDGHFKDPKSHPNDKTTVMSDAVNADTIDLFSIGVLNSLTAHIAVLDSNGKIIAINDAWKNFAAENGGDATAVNEGANYFGACEQAAAAEGLPEAKQALNGIKKVLSGGLSEYEQRYACHCQDQQRWFLMRATPMQFIGTKAVVSHINITDQSLAEESLVQRKKELTALNIIGRAMSASLSSEDVINAILAQISETIQPDLSMLFLKEGDHLVLKGVGENRTLHDFAAHRVHKVGQCLCGLSASTAHSVISTDINADNRCTWLECKQAGITSFAAIPLIKADEVIGTLGIASIKMRDFETRRQFLEAIANDAALYLDNALLYEKVKIYARDLETQLSEHKKMEQLLRQTQKMEAMGKLAGGIAHDFNNILSPILGYTELVLDDLSEEGTSYRKLKEVLKAGERARNLVRQILTYTRQTESQLSPIDAATPVKEAVNLLRSTIPSTIEIVENIAQGLAPIMGDPTQIHQIVMNLCTNADHAMAQCGGILEITLEQVFWDSKYIVNYKVLPKGHYIRLSVSDTGAGMAPDVLEAIFDPYFTTKKDGKGTGIGLSVVHGIIKSHRGEINVYSEPGKGSAFTIYFPVIEADVKTPTPDARTLPTGNESILFVDDEIAIVMMSKQVLEKLGYSVTTAIRSKEALRLFMQAPHRFNAVITDMTMPNMRGDQLAAKLMDIRPDLPIIICTGFSRHISKNLVRDSGVRSVLMKPFSQMDLALAVRNAIDFQPPL